MESKDIYFLGQNPRVAKQSQNKKNPEIGNRDNVATVESEQNNNEQKIEKEINYFHFFFDGTGNNKRNIKVRLDSQQKNFNITAFDLFKKSKVYYTKNKENYTDILTQGENKIRNIDEQDFINYLKSEEKPKKIGVNEGLELQNEENWRRNEEDKRHFKEDKYLNKYDDQSYYNYYTNIALLSEAINIKVLKNHHVFYIGGAGTISFDKDEQEGAAFAEGETGVREKVKQTLSELSIYLKNNSDMQDKLIYINLYGFSRGAFYARYFYSELKKIIASDNSEYKILDDFKYQLNFNVGIFLDTVSSEGKCHSNDADEYNLDNTYDGMRIYHICAQDEFRYHFPLTNIRKCLEKNENSIEIILPGSHSDIGGGYNEICYENDKDLSLAILGEKQKECLGDIPFYWFVNKGYYHLDEEGHFFENNNISNNINGALTVKSGIVRCIKREVKNNYQFVIAKIIQKIMIENFGNKILNGESEFCRQIDNLLNAKVDDQLNLNDYAEKIINWMPFGKTSLDIKQAKYKERNIFNPEEHGIPETAMKNIYNNYIHNSLINSTDELATEMTEAQKRAFYVANHVQGNNCRNEVAISEVSDIGKEDNNRIEINRNIFKLKPLLNIYIDNSSKPLGAIEQEKLKLIRTYNELFLGTYNYKLAKGEKIDSSVEHGEIPNYQEGILEELYKNSSRQISKEAMIFNNLNFYPIERVEIGKSGMLVDSTAVICVGDMFFNTTIKKYRDSIESK